MKNKSYLEVQYYEEEGFHILQFQGWVDKETFRIFSDALTQSIEQGKNKIRVNCQDLSYISEEGIELLVNTQQEVRQSGGSFIVDTTQNESANWKMDGFLRHYYRVLFEEISDA